MPWSGTGTFTRIYSWVAQAAAGFDISSSQMDTDTNDIVTSGFGNTLTRDGQGSATANLPMNGFRHTNCGASVNPTDYVTRKEVTGAIIGGPTPIGAGMDFWGNTAPNGWLFAYGQAVSRTTYAALFAIMGTTYGAGDGSTTFNLPDKRGRVSIPLDNMGGTAASRVTQAVSGVNATQLGAAGGDQHAQADTITVTPSGSITAASSATSTVTDPGHSHDASMLRSVGNGSNQAGGSGQAIGPGTTTGTSVTGITVATSVTTTVTDSRTWSATSALTGASQNLPPGIVCNYIIFAGAS